MIKKSFLLIVLVPLLASCAGYKSRPLKTLRVEPIKGHRDILFNSHVYNINDCEMYLGRNVIKEGFRPIQIALKNQSSRFLIFNLNNFSLKTTPFDVVARSVYQSVLARALGYGIPGVFFFLWPLIIPAIVDSYWASVANEQLLADYMEKSLANIVIDPDSLLEGLIFISSGNYNSQLNLTLIDRDSHEKIICKSESE